MFQMATLYTKLGNAKTEKEKIAVIRITLCTKPISIFVSIHYILSQMLSIHETGNIF